MAVKVEPRNPRFQVEILGHGSMGLPPVNALDTEELHKDVLSIVTSRRMGQACGTFHLTLRPRKPWHDIIHPMDHVEIAMWVPPRERRVVMRGFVDSVYEHFGIASGNPQHVITVAGRDYGKLMLISKIHALDLARENIPQEIKNFLAMMEGLSAFTNASKYRTGKIACTDIVQGEGPQAEPNFDPSIETTCIPKLGWNPSEVIRLAWELFFQPSIDLVRKQYSGTTPVPVLNLQVDERKGTEDELLTWEPMFSPQVYASYVDVWNFIQTYLHAPWREAFWEETPDAPVFTYRATPWLDFEGNMIQGEDASVENVSIPLADVIERGAARSDDQVVNYIFTHSSIMKMLTQMEYRLGTDLEGIYMPGDEAGGIFRGNPYLVGLRDDDQLPESSADFKRHGLRLLQHATPYLDMSITGDEAARDPKVVLERVLAKRLNLILKRAFDHGAVLEFGPLAIKGNETIKLGSYAIREQRGPLPGAPSYIEGISHHFIQGTVPHQGSFTTHLDLTRGRGYLIRRLLLQEKGWR